ncbi:MAG TPA: transcriptional regulator [Pseudogracilibacillus sp.]|nr:transcriptional regulator [Pseudogracilibacillus sp.]
MGDAERLEESRDILESAIAQSMAVYGVTPSVGRIYSVLYFSKTPMTLKQIQDHVAMSKASVSNGVRELLDTEMVSKIWRKGERQDHYIAEKDFFRNFINFFVKMLRQENNLIMKAMDQTEPILKEIASNSEEEKIKKEAENNLFLLEHSKSYLDWTMRIANAMESGDIFTYFPKK